MRNKKGQIKRVNAKQKMPNKTRKCETKKAK